MKCTAARIAILTALIILGSVRAPLAFAQSSPANTQALIKQLQDLVKSLQAQIVELQAQLKTAGGEIEEVKAKVKELTITQTLARGTRGDEVRQLQEFLKQDSEIYPDGLVTGFFGPATEDAVKKFQEKNGIEAVGIVGPKTRVKLQELITQRAGASGKIPLGPLTTAGLEGPIATVPATRTALPPPPSTTTTTPPATPAPATTTAVLAVSPPPSTATTTVATALTTPPPEPTPAPTPPPSPSPSPMPTPPPPPPPPPSPPPTPPPSSTATSTPIPPPPPPPPLSTTTPLPAPTYIRGDWSFGWWDIRDNRMGQKIVFQYSSDNSAKATRFRFYQKRPGDSAFSLAGEFSGFDTTSCTGNANAIYAGEWYLQGPPWGSCQYWFISRSSVSASTYTIGEYHYYVVAVDAAGSEGSPSPTIKFAFLQPVVITSPTASQITSLTPTFQWTRASDWPSGFQTQVALFDSLTATNPSWTSFFISDSSKIYDGAALDPAKQYRVSVYGRSANPSQYIDSLALPTALVDFRVSTSTAVGATLHNLASILASLFQTLQHLKQLLPP